MKPISHDMTRSELPTLQETNSSSATMSTEICPLYESVAPQGDEGSSV